MEKTACHLFVYGTLMRKASGALGMAQRARLEHEGVNLGPAMMAGAQLYDFGQYPGLTESADESRIVHGEVIRLATPERTLVWLDEYEGIADGEYVRLERAVHLVDGTALAAWVYVMTRAMRELAPVASGRWR